MMPGLEVIVVKCGWRVAVYVNGVKRWEGDQINAYKAFTAIQGMFSFQLITVSYYEADEYLEKHFEGWPNGVMDALDFVSGQ